MVQSRLVKIFLRETAQRGSKTGEFIHSYVRDSNYVKVGFVTSFNEGDMLNSAVSKIWRVHSELRKRRQLCKSRSWSHAFWGRLCSKGLQLASSFRVYVRDGNYVKVGWSHLFEGDCSKRRPIGEYIAELRKRRQLCQSRLVTHLWSMPSLWELLKGVLQIVAEFMSEKYVRDGNYVKLIGWSHLFDRRALYAIKGAPIGENGFIQSGRKLKWRQLWEKVGWSQNLAPWGRLLKAGSNVSEYIQSYVRCSSQTMRPPPPQSRFGHIF